MRRHSKTRRTVAAILLLAAATAAVGAETNSAEAAAAAVSNRTEIAAAAATDGVEVSAAVETNRPDAAVSAADSPASATGTNRLAIGFAEYFLAGNRLELADIADPAAPLPVCHFEIEGFVPEAISASNGVLRVEGADGFAEFDISDIFAPEPIPSSALLPASESRKSESAPSSPLVPALLPASESCKSESVPLLLSACGWDGVRIFQAGPGGVAGEQVTRCLTDGPALAVAAFPGGFAVALGTRGYALYDLDDVGLVTLRRQWPLETGRAVSAAFGPEAGEVSFDCQEGGTRHVATSPDSRTQPRASEP